MDYELTKGKKYNRLNIKKEGQPMKIKVWNKNGKAHATFKSAKAEHRKAIKAERVKIKEARRAIKQHRLLVKQARTVYKLSKV